VANKSLLLFIAVLLLVAPAAAAAGQPRVLVSLLPVHSLVAAVMQGVGTPELLLSGGASPHSFSLRPSQVRSLQQADLLVWVGPELETFLSRSLLGQPLPGRLLTLSDRAELDWLPGRAAGLQVQGDGHEVADSDRHQHAGRDSHFWLSPRRAMILVEIVCRELVEIDPRNAERYRENRQKLRKQLIALQREVSARLDAARGLPYVVFHDAYRYFEDEFRVSPAAIVSINPERPPGARRISAIRDEVIRRRIKCVFSEPQFEPRLVRVLTEGTSARSGVLDPLGAELTPGPEAYRQLLDNLARNFAGCLTEP